MLQTWKNWPMDLGLSSWSCTCGLSCSAWISAVFACSLQQSPTSCWSKWSDLLELNCLGCHGAHPISQDHPQNKFSVWLCYYHQCCLSVQSVVFLAPTEWAHTPSAEVSAMGGPSTDYSPNNNYWWIICGPYKPAWGGQPELRAGVPYHYGCCGLGGSGLVICLQLCICLHYVITNTVSLALVMATHSRVARKCMGKHFCVRNQSFTL